MESDQYLQFLSRALSDLKLLPSENHVRHGEPNHMWAPFERERGMALTRQAANSLQPYCSLEAIEPAKRCHCSVHALNLFSFLSPRRQRYEHFMENRNDTCIGLSVTRICSCKTNAGLPSQAIFAERWGRPEAKAAPAAAAKTIAAKRRSKRSLSSHGRAKIHRSRSSPGQKVYFTDWTMRSGARSLM